jgi:hypothetical protein
MSKYKTKINPFMVQKCEEAAAVFGKKISFTEFSTNEEGINYYHVLAGNLSQGVITFLGVELPNGYMFFYSTKYSTNDLVDMLKIDVEKNYITAVTDSNEVDIFQINI